MGTVSVLLSAQRYRQTPTNQIIVTDSPRLYKYKPFPTREWHIYKYTKGMSVLLSTVLDWRSSIKTCILPCYRSTHRKTYSSWIRLYKYRSFFYSYKQNVNKMLFYNAEKFSSKLVQFSENRQDAQIPAHA